MGPTKILADSYRFSASNLIQITSLCLPFIFASALFGNVLEQLWTGGWLLGEYLPLIVDLFIYPIYGGALIVFIERRTRGESPSNLEILSAAASIWLPLFVLTVIGTTLFLIGLFLFVIPGIWVLVKLAFSEYLLVLTRATPLDAIRQSFELTKGRFWPVSVLK